MVYTELMKNRPVQKSHLSHEDFGEITSIALVKSSCEFMLKELKHWMIPDKVKTSITIFPSSAEIVPEPLGVVLVISAWNYPFLLSLDPVIGAIAIGRNLSAFLYWKMVPGLKTGRLQKKTLTQPETDSPTDIPLGSPVAPSRVLPVRSNVGPSHHATSQPMVDSDKTQAPSETQPSGVGTSKPPRKHGLTLGKGIQKIIRAKKGGKCYVHIDQELSAMTGKYATPATNELGIQIRTLCPVKDVKSWLDLDETTKSAVIQAVLDKFQIGDDFHNDLQAQ
ncbi:uncharacterized protein LOC114267533 [Camellia sinensis]|uniref:uncharacterized protein LOC114267533 n=1 Tax=Camellia sinensis TaxID=4442 RepID=UPI0010369052|nr:uncharacterized protein LOC114267533 [Camellia sinensis]